MHDSHDSVTMINGVPVVAAPAQIDVTSAEQLRSVLLEAGIVFRIFTLTSLYRFIPRFDSLTEALLRRPAALVRPLRPRPSPELRGAAHPPGNLDGGVCAGG